MQAVGIVNRASIRSRPREASCSRIFAGIKSEERSQFKGRVPLMRSQQVLSAISGPARHAPRNVRSPSSTPPFSSFFLPAVQIF